MDSFKCTLILCMTFLFVPGSVCQAAEDIWALVNADFEDQFDAGGPVPGWAAFELIGTAAVGPVYYTGSECTCLGGDPNHRLKLEIGGGDEREWILVKEVNWGTATSLTTVSIHAGSHSWGGTGNAGLGIDLDGGTPSASSWTDCGANITEYTGPAGSDTCQVISLGGLAKPGGATTFTIVIRAYRPTGQSWNAHFDDLFVSAVDPNPPPAPTISSFIHHENIWTDDDDIIVSFPTYNADDYSFLWDHAATTDPDQVVDSATPAATQLDADNYDVVGDWYFHAKAHNSYGWGPTGHFGPLKIDDATPVITDISQATEDCSVTAAVTDTGGSPFDESSIEIIGQEELLTNGGFESADLTGWSTDGDVSRGAVRTAGSIWHPAGGATYEGTYMYYIDQCCSGTLEFSLYQEISVDALRRYRVSVQTHLGSLPPLGQSSVVTATLEWINGPWGGSRIPLDSESVDGGSTDDYVPLTGVIIPTGTTVTIVLHGNINLPMDLGAIYFDAASVRAYGGVADSYAAGVATWDGIYAEDGDVFTVIATDGAGNVDTFDSGAFSACDPGFLTGVRHPLWRHLR
jgi:hypothetical protein